MSSLIGKKVLVVDDFATMRRIIKTQLNSFGCTDIEEAADGQSAIEALEGHDFDLIVSDWNMAPLTGLDLLKHVRSNPRTKAIPFVMVTAEAKPENVLTAKNAGVNNYIVKPFDAATLKKKLEGVLA
jgi:two-component system chemotaxis response regulator CheY